MTTLPVRVSYYAAASLSNALASNSHHALLRSMIALSGDHGMKRIALAAVLLVMPVGPASTGEVRELEPGDEVIPLDATLDACREFIKIGPENAVPVLTEDAAPALAQCEWVASLLDATEQQLVGKTISWLRNLPMSNSTRRRRCGLC